MLRSWLASFLVLGASTAFAADSAGLPGGVDRQSDDQGGEDAGGTAAGGEEAGGEEAGSAAPSTSGGDGELSIYRELKTVEAGVEDLKEKVFRSKARLLLLEEKVIRGVVSGAKASIHHVNNLGPAFEMESLTYYFDGNPVYTRTAADGAPLSRQRKEDIYDSNVAPGNHTLSVSAVVAGRGVGVFAYLADYTFEVSHTFTFLAKDGKTTNIDAVFYRKGGALAEWEQAPTVEFRLQGAGKDDQAGDQAGAENTGSGS